jgi:hypothetical protein
MINAYPLQWPAGWPRAKVRKSGRFTTKARSSRAADLSVADGVQRVLLELERMGYTRDDIVISTNVPTRLDGLPRSDRGEPGDPGAAVYWRTRKGDNKVMAIDVYDRVADNLAAVAATLDAMRAIERHGGAVVLERAFTGFTALPAPGATTKRDWQDVLGLRSVALPTREQVKAAYRALASMHHPDKGGSEAMMAELNVAQDEALKEIFG